MRGGGGVVWISGIVGERGICGGGVRPRHRVQDLESSNARVDTDRHVSPTKYHQTPYKVQMKGGLWASLIPAHPCSMFCCSQPCLAEFHAGVFL